MRLSLIKGGNFRNFQSFEVSPDPYINIIFGENGSGKTSFLEAVYLFGFGRSFRAGGYKTLVNNSADSFTLFATGAEDNDRSSGKYGLSRSITGELQLRINGQAAVRISDLVQQFPLQLFTPDSVDVITSGPSVRRQLIDWGVFHVEPQFFSAWSSYNKLLRHRNKLLKISKGKPRPTEDRFWIEQLVSYGDKINQLRANYLLMLDKYLTPTAKTFLADVTLDISLKQGWDKDKSLSDALKGSVTNDYKYGHTTVGPHKADLSIYANGHVAKEYLSRGQMKVVVASFKLAQARLLKEKTGKQCIFVVDDLTSELDEHNQKIFCSLLEESQHQIFLSSVNVDTLIENFTKKPAMFHVEHGILKRHIEN